MSDAPSPAPAGPGPTQQQMAVEIPAGLEPVYSNLALIVHSTSEIIVDFARVLPNMPNARVQTRVLMTPLNAKLFLRALAENLARYEAAHGEIHVPTNLANQLFKPKPENPPA